MPENDWYAIATIGQREHVAARNLDLELAGNVLLPRIETWRDYGVSGRKRDKTINPLFPGYVFVQDHPDEIKTTLAIWRQKYYKSYVRDIVSIRDIPAPVQPGFIEALKLEMDEQGILRLKEVAPVSKYPPLTPGQLVRFTQGSFEGLCAQFVSLKNEERVKILFQMLSKNEIEVDRVMIEGV